MVQRAIAFVYRQQWLKPLEETVQKAVSGAFKAAGPAGSKLKDVLNGVWLGHPLHPALTDVPIGAWTTACVLDVIETTTGSEPFGTCADLAVALGLVGALGSALTGLADWQYLTGPSRRLGMAHGLLNVGVVALYSTSLALRRSGSRGAGQALSTLGYMTVAMSAEFGGTLVFRHLANVNHADTETMPRDFLAVLPEADLPEGTLTQVNADGTPVLLLKRNGQIHALAEICSHLGAPLAEGELRDDDAVICPWHGSIFSLADGHIIRGPATTPQPCFETRVRAGQIEVRLPPAVTG